VLHCLGFAGFGIWPLALVCLLPLWQALEEARQRLRAAALAGFAFGWVSHAGGYYWLWRIVDVFLGGNVLLGAAVWLADSAWFALRCLLYALLYVLVRRRGWSSVVAGVPTLIAVEWLFPLLFPVHLGHAFSERVTLLQISDLGGPLILTAVAALLNAAAFATWQWRRGDRHRPLGLDAPGAVSPDQPDDDVQEKSEQAARDHQRYLDQTRELLAGGAVDLVVWPETVYTRGLRGPLPISGTMIRDGVSVPLLFGAAFVRGESGRRLAHNSALLIDADGVIRSGYDKNLLIPFTEYVPFADVLRSNRYLVRATNSGISAVIDPAGRVVARTGLSTRENLRATVGRFEQQTLYTRWGDWVGWSSLLVVATVVTLRRSTARDVEPNRRTSLRTPHGEVPSPPWRLLRSSRERRLERTTPSPVRAP
jgi:apolipoprotein N-acyltransferase